MDTTNITIWQQAAGDTDRDYADWCLKWDVILNGPGYAGRWPDCRSHLQGDGFSPKKLTDLQRFCEEMQDGDLVVLRLGTAAVRGVGQIVGPYEWLEEFGDVDGWDLQHVRRVRWLWKSEPASPKTFDTYALKLGDTTQRLTPVPVTDWLSSLDLPASAWTRPLAELPESPSGTSNAIGIEEISEFLFDSGVASASIRSPGRRDRRTHPYRQVVPAGRQTFRARNGRLLGRTPAAHARLDSAADGGGMESCGRGALRTSAAQ